MMHHCADLLAIARKLRNKSDYKALYGATDRHNSAWSCKNDLNLAQRSLAILLAKYIDAGPEERDQDPDSAAIGGALFMQAVILYARATDTSSNSRRPSGIASKLSVDQSNLHKKIMQLRNDAIAHFGPGGDGWVNETVVVLMLENDTRFPAPYERYNYRGNLAIEFSGLVDCATTILDRIILDREEDLWKIFENLYLNDDFFRETIHGTSFNPEEFFETISGRESFARAVDRGHGGADLHEVIIRPARPAFKAP